MNKKIAIGGSIGVAIVAVAVFGFLFIANDVKQIKENKSTLIKDEKIEKKIPSTTLTDYSDSSGFSIQYPDDLSIKSNKITDNSTYADISITSSKVEGSLSLRITDTKYKTLDEWKKDNANLLGENVKDETLGSLQGIEVRKDDKTSLTSLDQTIKFRIEVEQGENVEYWNSVYKTVRESFAFSAPPPPSDSSNNTVPAEDEVILEGEEIIE